MWITDSALWRRQWNERAKDWYCETRLFQLLDFTVIFLVVDDVRLAEDVLNLHRSLTVLSGRSSRCEMNELE